MFETLFGYLACGTEVRAILLSFAVMSIFPQGQQKNKKQNNQDVTLQNGQIIIFKVIFENIFLETIQNMNVGTK